MKLIQAAYVLLKETVTAIIMLDKNRKTMGHSPDRNTEVFTIVFGIFQEDSFVPYLFILDLDWFVKTSINLMTKNCFSIYTSKTQTISQRNYDWCRLRGWPSASNKYKCRILQLCLDEQRGTRIFIKYKIIFLFLTMMFVWSWRAIAESSHTRRGHRKSEEPVNDWISAKILELILSAVPLFH